MSSIASRTVPESRPVQWIKEQWDAKLLLVDDSFQRRFVWQEKHQIKLIETVLLGFATPEIFVWTGPTDPDNGKTSWSIVDGQQRVRSLMQFIRGKFALKEIHLSKESKDKSYIGKFFDELDPDEKSAIWKYKLRVNFIENEISRSEIKKMFLRLNSTNMSLNPQELRHAEFDGEFVRRAELIANDPVWRQPGKVLFTETETRRMRDVQFVTSILIYMRRGLNEDLSQTNINAIYDSYNVEYEEAGQDAVEVIKLASTALAIAGSDAASLRMLRSKIHLYTLMLAIPRLDLAGTIPQEVGDRYKDFVAAYQLAGDEKVPETQVEKVAQEYRQLSLEGVQKRQNRSRRVSLLARWLRDGNFKSVLMDHQHDEDDSDENVEVQIIDGSETIPDEPRV